MFYVYFLKDPRNAEIFYVGKGKNKRMYDHVAHVKRGILPNNNPKLFNKIKKILDANLEINYEIYFNSENEKECYTVEKNKIIEIGLKNLCNLTEGGLGGDNLSKNSRYTEICQKMSNTRKGLKQNKDWIERKNKKVREYWSNSENRVKQSKRCIGRKHSKETIAKFIEIQKNRDPEIRKKAAEKMRGRKRNPESIVKAVASRAWYRPSSYTKKLIGEKNSISLKKKYIITFDNLESLTFIGKKELKKYIDEYNLDKNKNTRLNIEYLIKFGENKNIKCKRE